MPPDHHLHLAALDRESSPHRALAAPANAAQFAHIFKPAEFGHFHAAADTRDDPGYLRSAPLLLRSAYASVATTKSRQPAQGQ